MELKDRKRLWFKDDDVEFKRIKTWKAIYETKKNHFIKKLKPADLIYR